VTRALALEKLRAFLVDELGVRDELLQDETALMDAGLIDSLGVVEIIAFCEENLGCQVPPEEIAPDAFRSLASLAESTVERWHTG
jgi:acyl carrier protein